MRGNNNFLAIIWMTLFALVSVVVYQVDDVSAGGRKDARMTTIQLTATSSVTTTATPTATSTSTSTSTSTPTITSTPTAVNIIDTITTATPLPASSPTDALSIDLFTARTEDISDTGKEVIFNLETTGAVQARIYSGTSQFNAKSWDVNPNGFRAIPFGRTLFRNPTMSLVVTDGRGNFDWRTITIPWSCEFDYFFTPEPTQCPLHEESQSIAAEQQFENGRMIWIESVRLNNDFRKDHIYVFIESGLRSGTWERFDNIVPTGDTFAQEPPSASLQAPQRGFGMVWQQNDALREELGWALAGEAGFSTKWQWQLSEANTAVAYVQTIDGKVIELYGSTSGGWRYIK